MQSFPAARPRSSTLVAWGSALRRVARPGLLAGVIAASGCGGGGAGRDGADTVVASEPVAAIADTATDSTSSPGSVPGLPTTAAGSTGAHGVPLPPLQDSIAQRLVFAPVTQRAFVAAVRGKRLLMDLGRVDTEVRKDSARARAFREAVAARSPFPRGMRVRLRGPWGSEDAEILGFDGWNGRIVATLRHSPLVDSLASTSNPMTALAERTGESRAAETRACEATAIADAMRTRAQAVGDSLQVVLEHADSAEGKPPARIAGQLRKRTTWVPGCFGAGRVVLAATRWAGASEWVRERVVLLDEAGAVKPLAVADLRFRAHELLGAFDADGDGVDDVAARATGDLVGGTVVLRLVDGARLERMAAGFAWESR